MRIDHRVLIIIAMVLMIFSCSSKIEIEESAAKPVAREFLQAISQTDFETAWNIVNPSQKKMLTFERFKSACTRLLKKANLDQPTVQIKACTDKDGKAIAHAALVKGSKRFRIDIQLWFQNETWVVQLGREFF